MEEPAEKAAAVDIRRLLDLKGDGVHKPADYDRGHGYADGGVEQDHAAVGIVQAQLVDDDEVRHHQRVERHEYANCEEQEKVFAALEAEPRNAVARHAGDHGVDDRGADADDNRVEHHPPEARDGERVYIVLYLTDLRQREGRAGEKLKIRLERGEYQPDQRKERIRREEDYQEPAEDINERLLESAGLYL